MIAMIFFSSADLIKAKNCSGHQIDSVSAYCWSLRRWKQKVYLDHSKFNQIVLYVTLQSVIGEYSGCQLSRSSRFILYYWTTRQHSHRERQVSCVCRKLTLMYLIPFYEDVEFVSIFQEQSVKASCHLKWEWFRNDGRSVKHDLSDTALPSSGEINTCVYVASYGTSSLWMRKKIYLPCKYQVMRSVNLINIYWLRQLCIQIQNIC